MTEVMEPPRFRLWQEALFAYVAPALCAGIGGIATGQTDLVVAALTSIAGTSALVAVVVGAWLQRNESRRSWLLRIPRIGLVAGFTVAAAALAELIAWSATQSWPLLPDRIRIDFPIAAALATIITTWRWRAAQAPKPAPAHRKTNNRKDIS
ncbi:MAG: hypothetical protein JWN03_3148 [Nocardia sp.]|uniref:hypothetical protein n=1 Tax=Nocardia sp. TaxID=1821 RepID=UPI002617F3AC|nr:hypothetical protein [Nocardia sp.]MCU1642873.1 hypothetical protein [Nocardia sp.]